GGGAAGSDGDARRGFPAEPRRRGGPPSRGLLVTRRPPFGIEQTVGFLAEGVATVRSAIPKLLSGRDLASYEERRASFAGRGVPAALADEVAAMVPSYSAFDIVQSAALTGHGVGGTAARSFGVAHALPLAPQ